MNTPSCLLIIINFFLRSEGPRSVVTKTEHATPSWIPGSFGFVVLVTAQFVFNLFEIRIIAKLKWICIILDPRDRMKIDDHIVFKPKNKLPCHFPILVGLYREQPCTWSWMHEYCNGPPRDGNWRINCIFQFHTAFYRGSNGEQVSRSRSSMHDYFASQSTVIGA